MLVFNPDTLIFKYYKKGTRIIMKTTEFMDLLYEYGVGMVIGVFMAIGLFSVVIVLTIVYVVTRR
jgi:uncharacterized membrane protein (DUF485 family)